MCFIPLRLSSLKSHKCCQNDKHKEHYILFGYVFCPITCVHKIQIHIQIKNNKTLARNYSFFDVEFVQYNTTIYNKNLFKTLHILH